MSSSIEYAIDGRIISLERFFGEGELAFKGHFPKTKILPGVMLVELALFGAEIYLRERGDSRRLAEITSAMFLAPVFPGHTVRCQCEFGPEAEVLSMKSVLSRGGTKCATVKAIYSERN
jgi:3-hydroxymyristoyl/3-hydroxydecanoyl-(acyl carrier protein) dehydratase